MLAKLICRFMGHKWQRGKNIQDLHNNFKRCTRCGLTKPVKSRQQKRDDTTKELTAKARKE